MGTIVGGDTQTTRQTPNGEECRPTALWDDGYRTEREDDINNDRTDREETITNYKGKTKKLAVTVFVILMTGQELSSQE